MKLRLRVVGLFLGIVILGIIVAASAYTVKKDMAVSASNNAHSVPVATGGTCKEHGAGWYDCVTNFCNTQGLICCPPGHPYLNHCDCKCYQSNDFSGAETEQGRNCQSYSNCNY